MMANECVEREGADMTAEDKHREVLMLPDNKHVSVSMPVCHLNISFLYIIFHLPLFFCLCLGLSIVLSPSPPPPVYLSPSIFFLLSFSFVRAFFLLLPLPLPFSIVSPISLIFYNFPSIHPFVPVHHRPLQFFFFLLLLFHFTFSFHSSQ